MKTLLLFLRNARLWLFFCALILALLCIALVALAPQQVPLLLYKLALVLLGALALYIFDRIFFWYADPGGYLHDDWRDEVDADRSGEADYPVITGCYTLFVAAQYRRAVLIAVGMLAAAWGL